MDAAKLVQVYLKMRDTKDMMVRDHETKLAALTSQMEAIEQELIEICKATGQQGGKTPYGSFTKTVKTRYWTNDWDSMYRFIKTHDLPQLLERRIHQGNFKEFMEANPGTLPEGLNVDSRYAITVRRSK
jgi:hypothetical protein